MPAAETAAHRRLKALAAAWVLAQGYDALAAEVALPRAPYRADLLAARTGPAPEVALFECKQARSDLLRDAAAEAANRERLAALHARRVALEEQLAVHRPDLRAGETLFPEMDRCDFSDLRHDGYHALVVEIRRLKARLYGRTKFARLARWRVADACYLVAEPGVCAAGEVPEGWGLLEREGEALVLRRRPARLGCADPAAAIAALARVATGRTLRELGVARLPRPAPAG